MDKIIEKIKKALSFNSEFFRELHSSPDTISQALVIVIISSLAAGIGSISKIGLLGLFAGTLGAFINWFIWVYIVYIISLKFAPELSEKMSPLDFIRALCFANAPGILRVLGIISPLYYFVNFIAYIWMIAIMSNILKFIFEDSENWIAVQISSAAWVLMLIAAVILSSAVKGLGF